MATKSDIKTASVLAFERKLDTSDAFFFSGKWDNRTKPNDWKPIALQEKSVRGTISNRLKAKDASDPTKLDAKVENPNLQTVDVAALPMDADTLKIMFTLKVLGGAGMPSACNSAEYQSKLVSAVQSYANKFEFSELANRYAANVANGRFLWRNRIGAEQIEVNASQIKNGVIHQTWQFDALSLSTRNFDAHAGGKGPYNELAKCIKVGLNGKDYTLIEVTAFVRVGGGQEVYPSQELILDKGDGKKSKTLYAVNGIAGMHSQKISNAIRTIDTWYSDEPTTGPIPIETYGAVTALGRAFRPPAQKNDFYTLFDSWILKDAQLTESQQHYVMGVLVRGGVFGEAEKEAK
jgi:CRISPR-associated protein Csy3